MARSRAPVVSSAAESHDGGQASDTDACIAAGRFNHFGTGLNVAVGHCLAHHVKCGPVFDRCGVHQFQFSQDGRRAIGKQPRELH